MRESEPLHVAPPALLRVAATGEVRALIEWCLQQEQRFDQHLQEALFERVHLGQWPVMHEVMKFLMNWRLTSAVALIDSLKSLQVPCPVSESEILTELCHVAWPARRWYAWQHFAARLFGGPQMRDPFDPPKWAE